jgi:hypothetical protein
MLSENRVKHYRMKKNQLLYLNLKKVLLEIRTNLNSMTFYNVM